MVAKLFHALLNILLCSVKYCIILKILDFSGQIDSALIANFVTGCNDSISAKTFSFHFYSVIKLIIKMYIKYLLKFQ